MRLLIAALVAGCLLTAARTSAAAPSAAPKIEVTEVQCAPEGDHSGKLDVMYLHNRGDAPQDLAGWQLKSDPEDGQSMLLDPAGTLQPAVGSGIDGTPRLIVSAGAHAVPVEGVLVWSSSEILRDLGDPVDYVRLYDPNGNLVDSKDCNQNPVPLITAVAATPTPPPQVGVTNAQSDTSQSGNQDIAAGSQAGTTQLGAQASTGTQNSAAAPLSGAGGPVPAPNSGIGSLAPVNTSPGPFAVGALVIGMIGLATSGVLLLRRGLRRR